MVQRTPSVHLSIGASFLGVLKWREFALGFLAEEWSHGTPPVPMVRWSVASVIVGRHSFYTYYTCDILCDELNALGRGISGHFVGQ